MKELFNQTATLFGEDEKFIKKKTACEVYILFLI